MRIRSTLFILMPVALASLAAAAGGCESDYVLGLDTPVELGSPTPGEGTEVTPPIFEATPTATLGTPEPGDFEALLRVEPPELSFGPLIVGCQESATLRVINDGTVPVTVTNVRLTSKGEVVDLRLSDDLTTLYPGDEGSVWVDAVALAVGDEDVKLWIDATEAPAARVPIASEVKVSTAPVTEVFFQKPEKAVDVLWVIDNSGSMSEEQKIIANNIDEFLNAFAPLDIEYHMGLITTDTTQPSQSGRLQGTYEDGGGTEYHYVTWIMRDEAIDEFGAAVKRLDGGSGAEAGLEAMHQALGEPLASTYNHGFLRDEAFLSVIFVSDEEDQSKPISATGSIPQGYIDFMVNLKGGAENVIASAIINLSQPYGYVEVANALGGVITRIKSDFADTLAELAWYSAGYQRKFPLEDIPVSGEPMQVKVNGVEIQPGPTTWTYDAEHQVISFADVSIPPDGAKIEVTYLVTLTCDDL